MCEQLSRPPDYLFAAVSTTGGVLGCSRRLLERFPDLRVIAVDAVGCSTATSAQPSDPALTERP